MPVFGLYSAEQPLRVTGNSIILYEKENVKDK
jgi:hypothetical protein